MAKIQFSAIVGDARKKIGGVVFTKGRTGAAVRRKVSPIQPRSQAQRNVRSNFTGFSKSWGSTLTGTQRAGWDSLATTYPRRDVFGQTKVLTGLQMYQSCNRNLASIGVAAIADAPLALSAGAPGTLTLVATAGVPALTVDYATDPTSDEKALVFAAPPMSAGRKFVGKRYRLIYTSAAGAPGPLNILSAYNAKFGTLVIGQNINVLVKYVNKNTGAAGTPSAASVVIAT